MIQNYNDYRSYLRYRLTEKIRENPQYSLRAFSKQLALAPGFVSDILNGRKNISIQSISKIVEGLKLNATEATYFNLLVQLESATTQESKLKITKTLESLYATRKSVCLNLDHFRIISDWYHVAILEMATSTDFVLNAVSISKNFEISKLEAQAALDRLLRLDLLELDLSGRYKKTNSSLLAQSEGPNEGLRRFHRQMLQKAIECLETQSNKEKFVGSETVAFDANMLPQVRDALEECFTKIVNIAKKSNKKNSIYHLGIQFFKINKGEKK